MVRKVSDAVCENHVKSQAPAYCAGWRQDRDLWGMLDRVEWVV